MPLASLNEPPSVPRSSVAKLIGLLGLIRAPWKFCRSRRFFRGCSQNPTGKSSVVESTIRKRAYS